MVFCQKKKKKKTFLDWDVNSVLQFGLFDNLITILIFHIFLTYENYNYHPLKSSKQRLRSNLLHHGVESLKSSIQKLYFWRDLLGKYICKSNWLNNIRFLEIYLKWVIFLWKQSVYITKKSNMSIHNKNLVLFYDCKITLFCNEQFHKLSYNTHTHTHCYLLRSCYLLIEHIKTKILII